MTGRDSIIMLEKWLENIFWSQSNEDMNMNVHVRALLHSYFLWNWGHTYLSLRSSWFYSCQECTVVWFEDARMFGVRQHNSKYAESQLQERHEEKEQRRIHSLCFPSSWITHACTHARAYKQEGEVDTESQEWDESVGGMRAACSHWIEMYSQHLFIDMREKAHMWTPWMLDCEGDHCQWWNGIRMFCCAPRLCTSHLYCWKLERQLHYRERFDNLNGMHPTVKVCKWVYSRTESLCQSASFSTTICKNQSLPWFGVFLCYGLFAFRLGHVACVCDVVPDELIVPDKRIRFLLNFGNLYLGAIPGGGACL